MDPALKLSKRRANPPRPPRREPGICVTGGSRRTPMRVDESPRAPAISVLDDGQPPREGCQGDLLPLVTIRPRSYCGFAEWSDLLEIVPAAALARFLAYGLARAARAASASVLACNVKRALLIPAIRLEIGCVALHLRYFGFDEVMTAAALAGLRGDGFAATCRAATNVVLLTRLHLQLAGRALEG